MPHSAKNDGPTVEFSRYSIPMKTEPKTAQPRPHPEMHEGPEAFDRFRQAVKAVLRVPKSAMPPSPFSKKKS